MNQKRKKVLWNAVAAVLLCTVTAVGYAHQQKTHYKTEFTNIRGWKTYSGSGQGSWENAKKTYRLTGGAGYKSVYEKQTFSDLQLTAAVTINRQVPNDNDTSAAEGGLLFRLQHPEAGVDGYDGYYFGLDVVHQRVILGKSNTQAKQSWTELARKKMTLEYGKSYRLTVKASGSHIQCFVNEKKDSYPKIDLVDDEFSAGMVGLRGRMADVSFKKLTVGSYPKKAMKKESYTNALVPEAADPDVLYYKGTYYMYPTHTGGDIGGIKVYTSTDLTHWTDKGLALSKDNVWGTTGFWAPDLIERDGKFYMYYTANEHLAVAVSDSPLGPFKQEKKQALHEDINEIDANAFKDDDGQYYLYFVRFHEGNEIWGARLKEDMQTIEEDTVTKIIAPSQEWEKDMAHINEGPYMLKKDGRYYLTYSGSHFESPQYGSGYATSKAPLGEFEKYKNNPIMQSNAVVHGAGHHGITQSPDGKELFMVYHRHESIWNTDPREFAIDRMRFTKDEEGETVLEVFGPTVTPQALPSGAVNVENFIGFDPQDLVPIKVKKGTAPEKWNLPKKVGIITSTSPTGQNPQLTVKWEIKKATAVKDKVRIKGKIKLPKGVANLGKLPLKTEIEVIIE